MSDLVDRLRHQLPHNADGGYHNIGMGYFDRKDVAEAADRIEEQDRTLSIMPTEQEFTQMVEQIASLEMVLKDKDASIAELIGQLQRAEAAVQDYDRELESALSKLAATPSRTLGETQ